MVSKITQTPDVLEGAPLRYAPVNELGVVFLFAHLAKRWRLRIDAIQPAFPDCIAYQKTQDGEKRIRIEFEWKSRNFKTHKHDPKKCDWIVCWEHNWPDVPNNLQVIELRREFGLGFNIWIVPIGGKYKEMIKKNVSYDSWSVPSQAHKDDIILFHFTRPDQNIAHIYKLLDDAHKIKAWWKEGMDYMAPIKPVCRLNAPIFYEDMKRDRILSTSHFVRGSMQTRFNASEYWPYLYDKIVRRNPSVKKKLQKYAPEEL